MSNQHESQPDKFAPLPESFRLRLEMKSDWHVGAGAGRPGDVDRLVRRDEDGLPFVPGKTLTGIWRDACERVALGLDDGVPAEWSRWIPVLFGDQAGQLKEELHQTHPDELRHPRPASLSVSAARLETKLRTILKAKPAVCEAITFVKPGVRINRNSGRAAPRCLRFEEMARIGAVLFAYGSIDVTNLDEEQKRAATALLLAGTKLVERIGAKRRRGAGRCQLTVWSADDQQIVFSERLLGWLDTLNDPNSVPRPPERFSPDSAATTFALSTTEEWIKFDLQIEAKSPVIITARTVGNFVETTDYIPGTYLLPIITRYLGNPPALRTAITNGDLVVTNATPIVGQQWGRHVPFSLFFEKLDGGLKNDKGKGKGRNVYNRFYDKVNQKRQVKSYRSGYIGQTAMVRLPIYETVKLTVAPHNVVLDELQRPAEAVGGIFSYQAIKPGTIFGAELRLRAPLFQSLPSGWLDRLQGEHRLGRSKKDDYGLVHLIIEEQKSDTQRNGQPDDNGKELIVWLLSDLLLRDERLRPTASVEQLRKTLGDKLQVELKVRDAINQGLRSNLSRPRRTDSWQVSWGLPRPALVGLAAGSCIYFDVIEGNIDSDVLAALRQIENEGLGERRAEGYGRLCFNDPLLRSQLDGISDGRSGSENEDETGAISDLMPEQSDSFDYARIIEREAVRRETQRRVLALAAQESERKKALGIEIKRENQSFISKPRMSQLGGLRSVISKMQTQGDADRVIRWIELLRPKAKDKGWPDENLRSINDLIARSSRVWELLDVNFDQLVITTLGQDRLKAELWAESVRALVDACVRAHKRDLEKTLQPQIAKGGK
ncbi:MAG: hypothetical protein DMF61_18570 [Blastocatellia bacterium AA13]|nr:MAG: hypothetical protein DMF61_18570 [Blastocatellia bacterium AA13]